jgi:hypothetical protein
VVRSAKEVALVEEIGVAMGAHHSDEAGDLNGEIVADLAKEGRTTGPGVKPRDAERRVLRARLTPTLRLLMQAPPSPLKGEGFHLLLRFCRPHL